MANALLPTLEASERPNVATLIRRPSLDDVWAAVAVLVPALVSLGTKLVAIDLAYHVRAGEQVLGGSIPRVDTWTFTIRGAAWVDQQWGAQAILALAHRGGGFATIVVLRAVLTGLAFGLVYLACRARGAGARTASLLTLGGWLVCLQTLSMRPQLFGVTLFAASLWILAGRRTHPARVWALPVIAVVWANVHGSFALAPMLVLLAMAEDLIDRDPGWRRLALVGGLTALATLVNPFGAGAWAYIWNLSTDPVIRATVTEWAPMSLGTFSEVAFFVSAAAIAVPLVRRRGPAPWGALLWLTHVLRPGAPRSPRLGLVGARRARGGVRLASGRDPRGASGGFAPAQPRRDRVPGGGHPPVDPVVAWSLGRCAHGRGPHGARRRRSALPGGNAAVRARALGILVRPRLALNAALRGSAYGALPPGRMGRLLHGAAGRRRLGGDPGPLRGRSGGPGSQNLGPLIAAMRTDPGWHLAYEDPDGLLFERYHYA